MSKFPYRFYLLEHSSNVFTFKAEDEKLYAHVFILEDNIIRILIRGKELKVPKTWWVAPGMKDVPLEGRDRFDLSPFTLPSYKWNLKNDKFKVYTSNLRLSINLENFICEWYAKKDDDWYKIAADRETQSYNFNNLFGDGVYHYMKIFENEDYYGLGEKSGEIERNDRRFRMFNIDALGYDAEKTDPLYKHIPFYIVRNRDGSISFGIFYDVMAEAIFDFGLEKDGYHGRDYRYFKAEDGDLDYYFILGPSLEKVVSSFVWLTGKPLFPPKWSIGYSGSAMSYTEAENAQEELMKFLEKCEKYDIPTSSFHLSSGYTTIGKKRYVFTWNKKKIPSPKELISKFHEKGIKLIANIKPFLLVDHPFYEKLKDNRMFILDRDETEPQIIPLWDDLGSYIDFTNKEAFNWWKEKIKESLLSYGIDAIWNDNNEFEIMDSKAKINNFGKTINFEKVRALFPLLMAKASFEATKEYDDSKRPFLVSRSYCPGMQRYCQTWTGDNFTEWKTLRYNHYMGLGLILSGVYNFGHDVGGFYGPAPEPELFLRWIQYGIFMPRFTIHSWNSDGTANEPWMYPEILEEVRELIKFRHRLIPYFYQLFYEAHEFYKPVVRPVFYEFEEDSNTFQNNKDDIMVGPFILFTPVFDKGAKERDVYLPYTKDGWIEYLSNKVYEGGKVVRIKIPLDSLNFFIRGGSIIPLNDLDNAYDKKSKKRKVLWIFPHVKEGRTFLKFFEDDGFSERYLKGEYAFLNVELESFEDKVQIRLEKEGEFVLPYEEIKLQFPVVEKREIVVYFQNKKVYEGKEKDIVLKI
ncbi:MAG: glycoside hydrolase family 31 protein [Caldanaerobacter subterraneus]|nr:glycoside hydrolase family 31 protein [Caldanaerobacter subterraneus]